MSFFYNLVQTNNTNESVPLVFQQTLNTPILQSPELYDVSVVRFSIPNYETPIFTFKDNTYRIRLECDSAFLEKYVEYDIQNLDVNYRGVFEIQAFVQMLNRAVSDLVDNIQVQTKPEKPFFTYNEVTKLMSLTCNKTDFGDSYTNMGTFRLYVNNALLSKIQGFPLEAGYINNQTYYRFRIMDLNDNTIVIGGANNLVMSQQKNTFDLMSDFNGLVLTTNLPIQNEVSNQSVSLPILQDYLPSDLDISTFNNYIVYNAIVPYRQIKFLGKAQFYNITINAFSQKRDGTLNTLFVPPFSSSSIKLMFSLHEHNKFA